MTLSTTGLAIRDVLNDEIINWHDSTTLLLHLIEKNELNAMGFTAFEIDYVWHLFSLETYNRNYIEVAPSTVIYFLEWLKEKRAERIKQMFY